MRIKTETLLILVDNAITEHRAAHDRALEADAIKETEMIELWQSAKRDAWLEFAKVIQAKLRPKTGVVTRDDIPSGLRSRWSSSGIENEMFAPPRVATKPKPYTAPHTLTQLKGLLTTISDDEVTTTGLQSLGFKPETYRSFFIGAGA